MAARRLKFKPKPSVTNSLRRARDKDDLPGLIQNEKITIDEESTKPVISEGTDEPGYKRESANISSETDSSCNQTNKKLKLEIGMSKNEPELNHELSESETTGTVLSRSVLSGPGDEQCYVNKLTDKLDLSNECDRVPLNGLPLANTSNGHNNNTCSTPASNLTADGILESSKNTDANIEIPINKDLDVNCTNSIDHTSKNDLVKDSDPECKNVPSDLPVKDSMSDTSKSCTKSDSIKKLPRFQRSRCKPVLSSSSVRKKSENTEIVDNSSNAVNHRIDSVIKSVESELSKINALLKENEETINSSEVDKKDQSCKTNQSNVIPCEKSLASNDEPNTNSSKRSQSALISTVDNFLKSTTKTEQSNEKTLNVNEETESNNTLNDKRDKMPNTNETCIEVLDSHSNKKTPNKVPVSPLRPTSKVLVPKPSPRLTDTTSRRISFQSSDSEEETKKRTSYVKQKTKMLKTDKEEKVLKTSKRKRSQGPTFSKLGQETLKELRRKLNGALENPDKNKLTMLDLIFYNPKNNPMVAANTNQNPVERKKDAKIEVSQAVEEALEEESVDDVESTSALPVPQLKVGPDGQVMLDPHSLIIETTGTNKSREELENSQVIQENGITRYNSYSKRKNKRSEWTPQETLQFYRALSTIGSDFSLMTQLFPKRTRHDLKLKFKREERINIHLIDKAMTIGSGFDFQALETELKRENEEIERKKIEKEQAKEAAKKERALKKEEALKNKKPPKRVWDKMIKIKDCAMKEFSKEELDMLYNPKYKTKRTTKKRKSRKNVPTEIDTDEELAMVNSDLEDDTLSVIRSISDIMHNRKAKKLKECQEINETLKKKLELESRVKKSDCEPESEEDVYTPNDPGAYMLFGSPLGGSEDVLEDPAEEDSDRPWTIEIPTLPTIEETVMVDNVEEVSELSELGSFGQNDMALDLSIPVRTSEILKGSHIECSLLNRHLISESIQIIDQLTSSETGNSCNHPDVDEGSHDTSVKEELVDSKVRLPSFESVSRSRPFMAYGLQVPSGSGNYEVQTPEIVAESSVQESREENTHPNVFVANFYRETEECILGD